MKKMQFFTRAFLLLLVTISLISCDLTGLRGEEAVPLSAPRNLRVEDEVLKWNPVEKAIGYTVEIKKSGTDSSAGTEYMVDTNEYSLTTLKDGEYSIRVKARGDSVLYSTSPYSDAIAYTRTQSSAPQYKDEVTGAFSSFDEINTRESYLGYGIDIINSTGVTSKNIKTTYPIFSKNAILNETLLKSNEHYSNLETIEASSIEEFKTKLASSTSITSGTSASASANIFGVSVGGGISFSAGYKSAFEKTSSETHSQYFLEIIAENQNYWLMLQTEEGRYRELLSPEFEKDLYDPNTSPAELFDKYGTHLITSVAMGGNITMFYTLYSTKEGVTSDQYYEVSASLKANADVAYGSVFSAGVSSGVGTGSAEAYQEIANRYGIRVEKKIVVSGGSGDFGIINESSLLNHYADWQKSLNAYPVITGIKDSNSLYPIWKLIDTSRPDAGERAAALEAHFRQYGEESLASLSENYGIKPPVPPTDIQNITVKTNTDYQEGEFVQIKAGDTFRITFDVVPAGATKYTMSFRSDSEYVTVDENGNVTVSADIPNQLPVAITVTAGAVEKTVLLTAITTCNVVFNTVVPDLTVPPLIGISSASTIPTPALYREGYVLEGWYRDASYTSKFDFDTELVVSNLVLYAKWIPIKPTLSFVTNGGSAVSDLVVAYGAKAEEPLSPSRDGYSFGGWFRDRELTVPFEFDTEIKRDLTLYAKWELVIYTVKFEANGGTPLANRTTSILQEYKITAVSSEKYNQIFMGWYRDEACTSLPFSFDERITADVTLYAKWEAIKPIVTFVSNGGSTVEAQTIASGTAPKEPTPPSRDGYTFVGWFCDRELTDEFSFDTPLSVHTTLYAKWERLTFTVSFQTNGGTPVSERSTGVEQGYLIGEPITERAHYIFGGWFRDAECTVRFYFDERIASSLTLYAKWELIETKVLFLDSDGVSPLVDASGHEITSQATNHQRSYLLEAAPVPYKSGYVFLGWQLGAERIGDITAYEFSNEGATYRLSALWLDERYVNPVPIRVSYVFEDGSEAAPPYVNIQTHYYEQPYEIESPIVVGYAPDVAVLVGTVPESALEFTVIYRPTPHRLLIQSVMADGSPAPEVREIPVLFGASYSVKVASLLGYTADQAKIEGIMGDEDITVTVTYTPNSYKIGVRYLMANGALAPKADVYTVSYGEAYRIELPLLPGYKADTPVLEGVMGAEDREVLITYLPKEYTVTVRYTVADGSVTLPDTVETLYHAESYTIEIAPLRGFTPDLETVSGIVNAENVMIDVTYRQNSYSVVYHANGGSGITPKTDFVYNVKNNLAVNDFERPSFVFLGWNTEANGTGTTYLGNEEVINLVAEQHGEIALYAQWARLSFVENRNGSVIGGTAGDNTVKTDISLAACTQTLTLGASFYLPVPTAEYYVFHGWYTEDGIRLTDGEGRSLSPWTLTLDTALYAGWEKKFAGYTYVKTAEEFKKIAFNLSGAYMLIEDIDLGSDYTPIGTYYWTHSNEDEAILEPFCGILDGDGHTVTYKLLEESLQTEADCAFGLFGTASGATFRNITVNASIEAKENVRCWECTMGSLVGWANNCAFEKCSTTEDTVVYNYYTERTYWSWFTYYYVGYTYAGGIVGDARSCTFKECVSKGTITAAGFSAYAGGIAGNAYNCNFDENCTHAGTLVSTHGSWIDGTNANGPLYGKNAVPWGRN